MLLLWLIEVAFGAGASTPNIVMILTDDLDVAMNGMVPLNKTRDLIGGEGATFENAFVSTPINVV